MLNLKKVLIETFVKEVKASYESIYGAIKPEYVNTLIWMSHLSLENIANSNTLYHDVEHTIMVTLAGQEILKGKHIADGDISAEDWLNTVIALLCHDIGYVKGICKQDNIDKNTFATGLDNQIIELDAGSTDASLMPYHVDRSKLFIQERFNDSQFEWVDIEVVCSYIEMTRFPIPADKYYEDTAGYPGLTRAADLIGQLGDPEYLRKIPGLFYEFEENGINKNIGYYTPDDIRRNYAKFYWNTVSPYIQDALRYLKVTQEGKQWISNLYTHVFVVEHEEKTSYLK